MTIMNSYKNGLLEGVMFCFYQDGKILLEDRGKGFDNEAIFPSGKIELKDKLKDDYITAALLREVSEEFNHQIKIIDKAFLGELVVLEINVLFYIFVITKWEGEFPEAIKELHKEDSKIAFFKIDEAKALFRYASAFETLNKVLQFINNKKR